jgi:hypothetical protein
VAGVTGRDLLGMLAAVVLLAAVLIGIGAVL